MRSRYRCYRCKKPIKLGEEQFLNGVPYGIACYKKIQKMEIAHCELQNKSEVMAPEFENASVTEEG
jgi:hypothetical protein